MGVETRVLLVEGDPARALVVAGATVELCEVDVARTPAAARAALARGRYAAVVQRVCPTAESPEAAASVARAAAACDPPARMVVLTRGGEAQEQIPSGATALQLPLRSAALRETLARLLATSRAGESPA